MKILTPVFENILFYSLFFISRIPIWFILIAAFFNSFIGVETALYLILLIILSRAYTESELAGGGIIIFSFMQAFRIVIYISIIILIYLGLIYFNIFAKPIDQILIALAIIIFISLSMGNDKNNKASVFSLYFRGFRQSFIGSIIVTLFWLYIAFVPDTVLGNVLVIVGIYVVEFISLFKRYNLPEYA